MTCDTNSNIQFSENRSTDTAIIDGGDTKQDDHETSNTSSIDHKTGSLNIHEEKQLFEPYQDTSETVLVDEDPKTIQKTDSDVVKVRHTTWSVKMKTQLR